MSLHLPSRRVLARSASAAMNASTTPLSFLVPCIQRRTIFGWGKRRDLDTSAKPKNTLTEEYLKRKPETNKLLVRGDLASSSIFEDEELAGPKPKGLTDSPDGKGGMARNPETMAAALDPDPAGRRRWERKMVIQQIHKRGRLTRIQLLKREERELLSKSHDFKTSIKKLTKLARQIAGKTVEDAIVQMRFSKKKAAKEVKDHLEHARNEAIVRRGMGLGPVEGEEIAPVDIRVKDGTKDGRRVTVSDPTRLYVDQAWVGRGLWGRGLDHRARGRIHVLKLPSTSLSVVLKEEATRMRLHQERETKLKNRKVWEPLPNRPVTAQRPYYSW